MWANLRQGWLFEVLCDVSDGLYDRERCDKHHMSRQNALDRIARLSKRRWGREWDIELMSRYGLKTVQSPTYLLPCYTATAAAPPQHQQQQLTFEGLLHLFKALSASLILYRAVREAHEVSCDTECVEIRVRPVSTTTGAPTNAEQLFEDFTLTVPNIVSSWKPAGGVSNLLLATHDVCSSSSTGCFGMRVHLIAPHEHLVMCGRGEGLSAKCLDALGLATETAALAAAERPNGSRRMLCEMGVRGLLRDDRVYEDMCVLFLDLPLNPSGKGWASPKRQQELAIGRGVKLSGNNARTSWSARMGWGAAEDGATAYDSAFGKFVGRGGGVGGGLVALRDLPAHLPLGLLRPTDDDEGEKVMDDFARNPMALMRPSELSLRSNVIVYHPVPEVYMFCVGHRNIRRGKELLYNVRVLRQNHRQFYGHRRPPPRPERRSTSRATPTNTHNMPM